MAPDTRVAPLRLGILGAARIARELAAAARNSSQVTVIAVASRAPARARAFAAEFGIPQVHETYESLLADPAIEAVYVPLPNSLHAPWTIRALGAGKHVLCEKPVATCARDAREMFALAKRLGLYLVEGFPYLAQPHMRLLRELMSERAIGTLQTVCASFGFTVTDVANIRLDPALGGGALLDAGTYPLSLVRILAGQRPLRVQAAVRRHPGGVDQTLAAVLEHVSGLIAQVSCSFAVGVHRHALLAGSAGVIQTTFPNSPPLDRPFSLQLKRGVGWDAPFESIEVPAVRGFCAEVESFAHMVRWGPGEWTGITPAESIDVMRTVEAIVASADSGLPVAIED